MFNYSDASLFSNVNIMSGVEEFSGGFQFSKETILPSTDTRSPFYINLPGHDAKPIDNLISFFKYWKYFIKALIQYFQDIALAKQFEANLSFQLISSIQFPGYKDLPVKIIRELSVLHPGSQNLPLNEYPALLATSPNERGNGLLSGNLSSSNSVHAASDSKYFDVPSTISSDSTLLVPSACASSNASVSTGNDLNTPKRPSLFKTKSSGNTSFLKSATNTMGQIHKRNLSLVGLQSSNLGGMAPVSNQPVLFTTDVKIPPNFYPQDSLFNSFAPILLNHHQYTYQTNHKIHRDLTIKLIPRLHILLRNLLSKIKEIKSSLKNASFSHTDISKEVSKTGQILNQYMNAVERYSNKQPVLKRKLSGVDYSDEDIAIFDDPFLLKLQVEHQLKHQILYESYMFASWVNLQNISKELFAYVLKELHVILDKFGKLQFSPEMFQVLKSKISNSSNKDWEHYISMNPNFLNTYVTTPLSVKRELRRSDDIVLPYSSSIHNKCLRLGILYKKSKLLKNYTRHFYLLTCNYLHEFRIECDEVKADPIPEQNLSKSSTQQIKKFSKDKIGGFIGHEDIPTKSYNLNDLVVKAKNEHAFKFEFCRVSGGSKKSTFKCLNQEDWQGWFLDLKKLCEFGPTHFNRFEFVMNRICDAASAIKPKPQDGNATIKTGSHSFGNSSRPESVNSSSLHASKGTTQEAGFSSTSSLSVKDVQSQGHIVGDGRTALCGMFTPTIRTPCEEGGNPFETSIISDLAQPSTSKSSGSLSLATSNLANIENMSLMNLSGSDEPFETPVTYAGDIPLLSISPCAIVDELLGPHNLLHKKEHESYLTMQQEILRQHQRDLMKLKDAPVNTTKAINLLQPPSLRRRSSSDSVHSFELPSPGIQRLVVASTDLIALAMGHLRIPDVELDLRKPVDDAPNIFLSNH